MWPLNSYTASGKVTTVDLSPSRLWIATIAAYLGLLAWLPAVEGQLLWLHLSWPVRVIAALAALLLTAPWAFAIAAVIRGDAHLAERLGFMRWVRRVLSVLALALVLLLTFIFEATGYPTSSLLSLRYVAEAAYAGFSLLIVRETTVALRASTPTVPQGALPYGPIEPE